MFSFRASDPMNVSAVEELYDASPEAMAADRFALASGLTVQYERNTPSLQIRRKRTGEPIPRILSHDRVLELRRAIRKLARR